MNSPSKLLLLLVCACLALSVCLHPAPAHAAIPNPLKSHLLDRASQHFQNNLQKWGTETTKAGLSLFWMLATIACCWELGTLALRGGSMDQALAFLVRFSFILGLWFYILQNAVPIGTAIIDSLRKLGATSSGLPDDLTMPSSILNIGFSLLWKTIKFVASTGWHAPIVAFFALGMALAILMAFGLTAINMFLLIVSQWFLLYGGIFFLGFGGAPWGSSEAKNYLYLALSIGAQLLAMVGVVGLGESFIQEQYAALSGDTSLGELCVIFFVGLVVFFLSNDIPKMFARFVPNSYSPPGAGVGTMIGGLGTAAAALAATGVMIKSGAANVTGLAKAGLAAHDAAKGQSQSKPSDPARSQTGVSAANGGGTIGAAGGDGAARSDGGARAGTQTQGPLAAMLSRNGIGNTRNSAESTNGSGARGGTQASTAKTSGAQKPSAIASPAQATEDQQGAGQTPAEDEKGSGLEADTATASKPTDPASAQTPESSRSARDGEGETSTRDAEAQSETGSSEETEDAEHGAGSDREQAERADTGSEQEAREDSEEAQPGAGRASSEPADSSSAASSTELQSAADDSRSAGASAPADTAASTSAGAGDGGTSPSDASSSSSTSGTAPGVSAAASASTGASANTAPAAGDSPQRAASGAAPSDGASGADISPSAPTADVAATSSASGAPASGDQSASAIAPASATSSGQAGESGSAGPAGPSEGAGQRGSTSIAPAASGASTFVAAAKILGAHAVDHQKGRFNAAKSAFMARADATAGGQIAQAIRKKYGLDKKASEASTAESTPRAQTGVNAPEPAPAPQPTPPPVRSQESEPKHPSEWATADDPMTVNQRHFLERRLGEENVDPDMTKADAAMLIEELLDERR
jgi:type IV secretion system protein TrbL